jgi:hypothetical protein
MLKNVGILSGEMALASAFPPAVPSGRVTAPSVGAARTTTPAALDIVVDDDVKALRPAPKGRKAALFVVRGFAAAAGGFAVVRAQGNATAATVSAAPARGAELGRPGPVAPRPPSVIDLDQEAATSAAPSAGAAAKASGSASAPRSKSVKTARPVHVPVVPGKRPRTSDDELDPGF